MFQVRAQLERTSSAKLDEMLSLQKSVSDWTGLGYDFSSLSIASTSKIENNVVKNDLASENINKGKSILGAPPKQDKKEAKTLGLRRLTLKSLNKRSSISVIIVELPVILDQIAISG